MALGHSMRQLATRKSSFPYWRHAPGAQMGLSPVAGGVPLSPHIALGSFWAFGRIGSHVQHVPGTPSSRDPICCEIILLGHGHSAG